MEHKLICFMNAQLTIVHSDALDTIHINFSIGITKCYYLSTNLATHTCNHGLCTVLFVLYFAWATATFVKLGMFCSLLFHQNPLSPCDVSQTAYIILFIIFCYFIVLHCIFVSVITVHLEFIYIHYK
jgi:hypothetical protein